MKGQQLDRDVLNVSHTNVLAYNFFGSLISQTNYQSCVSKVLVKLRVLVEGNSPQRQSRWASMGDRQERSHTTVQRGESLTGRGQTR